MAEYTLADLPAIEARISQLESEEALAVEYQAELTGLKGLQDALLSDGFEVEEPFAIAS